MEWEDLLRLLAACAAGAILGFERELHDKPAGLRTNIMICLGAAVFTVLSLRVSEAAQIADPARIAAQVVTGVGFLGAGSIIQSRGNVIGLTTAATIWIGASIGMAFGAGHYGIGAGATLLSTLVLFALGRVEDRLADWYQTARFTIVVDDEPDAVAAVQRVVAESRVRQGEWRVARSREGCSLHIEVSGAAGRVESLQRKLTQSEVVRSLRWT